MDPFLKQVADYLYQKYTSDLSEFCLVFPGRRAGVFFTAYLNEKIDKTIIAPEITTINQFVSDYSDICKADQVTLIFNLWKIYNEVTGFNESLDEFFFWGEILLADFDDIDKYMLNAKSLFTNITDLKELEHQFEYLSEAQKQAIENFWGAVTKGNSSPNKEKFLALWNKMATIYSRFQESLKQQHIGYNGLIYRHLAENNDLLQQKKKDVKKFVFIGFNALDQSERTLFKRIYNAQKGIFFWDYHEQYLKDPENEAGHFLRTNLLDFPMPSDFYLDTGRDKGNKISIVSAPGKIAQAQVINFKEIIQDFIIEKHFDNTALVLADESLLLPVISATGNQFDKLNITMGYPLTNTPVYGFLLQLLNLQRNIRKLPDGPAFYFKPVISLLNHQFVSSLAVGEFVKNIHRHNKVYLNPGELAIDPLTSLIFRIPEGWEQTLDYINEIIRQLASGFQTGEDEPARLEAEYLIQVYHSVNRLKDSLYSLGIEDFPVKILYRLIDQSLKRITIPFEGEPLTGLQVMGLLETRCLDFKNLVVFSANEGNLPSTGNPHSFIPYHLRKGHGMPTFEERDAMYSYYFYNLIQRAENTVLVYNSITDGTNSSEMSRYLFQLLFEKEPKPKHYSLNFNFRGSENPALKIVGTKIHQEKLFQGYSDKNLSPSALNTYLDCKLKFYFKYIAGLKEQDELKEEVDPVLFGNLFHYAVELVYKPFRNTEIKAENIDAILLDKPRLEEIILLAFAEKYYKLKPEKAAKLKMNGHNMLIAGHLQHYLVQLLHKDKLIAPFKILELEGEWMDTYEVYVENQRRQIRIGGIIDRIDETSQGIRIVDYKTGRNIDLNFGNWEQLVKRDSSGRRKEIFQTLVYAKIYQSKHEGKNIIPAIYRLDDLFAENFDPQVTFNNARICYQEIQTEFEPVLDELMTEIFSSTNVYSQTEETRKCEYCPFNKICNRG